MKICHNEKEVGNANGGSSSLGGVEEVCVPNGVGNENKNKQRQKATLLHILFHIIHNTVSTKYTKP